MKNDDGNLLQNFNRPMLPPDLRERTLGAAGLAMVRPAHSDFWQMLWESVWLRVAWSTGVAVFLVSHLLISNNQIADNQDPSLPVILVAEDPEDELFEVVRLSRINGSLPTLVGSQEATDEFDGGTTKGDVS